MPQAKTVDEVIHRLTQIVEDAKAKESRLGYFAVLYREVTIAVKQRIDEGNYFDDNARMEKFDVIFANRYLAAYDQMQSGSKPTRCWDYAFQVSQQWWPITLQHLLLGINAHINLDLGIAAVETVGPQGLPALQADFIQINDLLADLVGDVKEKLASVWPPLRWLNRYLGDVETGVINFSMTKARDAAWSLAQELAAIDQNDRDQVISRRDNETLGLGHVIRNPGFVLGLVTKTVRLGERGSVAQIITVLEGEARLWSLAVARGKPLRTLPPQSDRQLQS